MDSGSQQIDYKTHILIGYVSKGTMGVIFHWPHLPQQEEVQQKIDAVRETYAAFPLCTPTSIMPVKRKRFVMGKQGAPRPFRPRRAGGLHVLSVARATSFGS